MEQPPASQSPPEPSSIPEASEGLATSTSTASMPKLRLTLKLGNAMSQAGSSTEPASSTTNSAPPSATKKLGRPKGSANVKTTKGMGKGKTGKQPSALSLDTSTASAPATNTTTTKYFMYIRTIYSSIRFRATEKKELPAQFAEQIKELHTLRRLKTRKWTQAQATIKTLSGQSLVLPIWAREGTFNHEAAPESRSRRNSTDGALKITLTTRSANAGDSSVFICPEPTCGKVFDAKDKWKRHQVVHKKKAAKLQLKLPSLKLVQKQSEQAVAEPTSEPVTEDVVMEDAGSVPQSELTEVNISLLDSQLN